MSQANEHPKPSELYKGTDLGDEYLPINRQPARLVAGGGWKWKWGVPLWAHPIQRVEEQGAAAQATTDPKEETPPS